jgi:hypothetical protein
MRRKNAEAGLNDVSKPINQQKQAAKPRIYGEIILISDKKRNVLLTKSGNSSYAKREISPQRHRDTEGRKLTGIKRIKGIFK